MSTSQKLRRSPPRRPDLPALNLTQAQLDHAATIVAAWLGSSPDELTIAPATGGVSTPVYRVSWANGSAYLRLSETPVASLGPEELAHEVLLTHGVRVPAVIGYEPFDPALQRSLMLTTTVPGASLEDDLPADPAPILHAAGADLARIGQVRIEGFGRIERANPLPTRLLAPFGTWNDFVADLTSGDLSPWFEPNLISRFTELADTPPADPTRAVLAHGDFDPSHIFALGGRYTGIIDFGEIRGAEPTFDLGHLALHAPDALPVLLQGYATITPLSADIHRQIVASAIRIGWSRLTRSSARTNPPYADRLRSSMLRIASELA